MEQSKFFELIQSEREFQKKRWGATDHLNNEYNWGAYITAYTTRSLIGTPGNDPARVAAFKNDMIKVAALALAAVESL